MKILTGISIQSLSPPSACCVLEPSKPQDGISDISVLTHAAATGGAEPESIASIKFNAPLDYAAQGRCVTSEDYKVVVKGIYNDTKSIQVWGGESGSYDSSLGVVSTPEYGKVFISIKSTTGKNAKHTFGNIKKYDRTVQTLRSCLKCFISYIKIINLNINKEARMGNAI